MKKFLLKNWYFILMVVLSLINTALQFAVAHVFEAVIWLLASFIWIIVLIVRYLSYRKTPKT